MAQFTITITYPEYDEPVLEAQADAPDEDMRDRVVYALAATLARIAGQVIDETGNLSHLEHDHTIPTQFDTEASAEIH